jgi:hypothetical protein
LAAKQPPELNPPKFQDFPSSCSSAYCVLWYEWGDVRETGY